MARYIDATLLSERMYNEAFEKDSDMQRWDGGCWIRYKLFENVLRAIPSAEVVEMKDDLIRRQDALVLVSKECEEFRGVFERCKDGILSLRPAVVPVKRARWVLVQNAIVHGYCSRCGWLAKWQETDVYGCKYCPNCGSKMEVNDGEQSEV